MPSGVTLDLADVQAAIRLLKPAMRKDHPTLAGLYLRSAAGALTLSACDAFMAAEVGLGESPDFPAGRLTEETVDWLVTLTPVVADLFTAATPLEIFFEGSDLVSGYSEERSRSPQPSPLPRFEDAFETGPDSAEANAHRLKSALRDLDGQPSVDLGVLLGGQRTSVLVSPDRFKKLITPFLKKDTLVLRYGPPDRPVVVTSLRHPAYRAGVMPMKRRDP